MQKFLELYLTLVCHFLKRFTSKSNKQVKVKLLKQFDVWKYNVYYRSVCNRMPWLGGRSGILTTSGRADRSWWGTIISDNLLYKPAPWINTPMANPGIIWYWINEDDCGPDRTTGFKLHFKFDYFMIRRGAAAECT